MLQTFSLTVLHSFSWTCFLDILTFLFVDHVANIFLDCLAFLLLDLFAYGLSLVFAIVSTFWLQKTFRGCGRYRSLKSTLFFRDCSNCFFMVFMMVTVMVITVTCTKVWPWNPSGKSQKYTRYQKYP